MPRWDSTSLLAASDGALAREVAAMPDGEAGAAESELYRRFAPRVRLFGLRHLRDDMAADDLAQQVMLVAIERLRAGEVKNPDEIGSFILGTSRMMSVGLKRTERRRQDLHTRFDSQEAVDSGFDERMFDAARLGPCLGAIRDRERTILLLTFYADRSAIDIAAALGMTAGAVRVGRHRALASMRECLETRRQA
jgi:RNA polymerase sigma-70 factor (ECF subfamily)